MYLFQSVSAFLCCETRIQANCGEDMFFAVKIRGIFSFLETHGKIRA
jgi:hypothetical protein